MMSDKPKGNSPLSKMPTKQKVTAIIVVLLFVFVIYEAYGLFGGGGGKSAPSPQIQPVATAMNATPVAAGGGGAAPSSPTTPGAMPSPTGQGQISEIAAPRDVEILNLQQETQQKYISSINQLQILRIQREIAETNEAIATAKLATVTAETSMATLLTKPSAAALAAAAAAQSYTPVAPGGMTQSGPQGGYSVASVAMHQDQWSAVLVYQGKSYSVMVGDVLPTDNSTVQKIDTDGVVLEKNGKINKITMASSY